MGTIDVLLRMLRQRGGNQSIVEVVAPNVLAATASRFWIEDATTPAKRVKFDASGLTTERTITVPDGAVTLSPPIVDVGTLTIASGVATLPTDTGLPGVIRATIDTEATAATDDLDTITVTGGQTFTNGMLLILRSATSSRDSTAKHGTGNLTLSSSTDYTIDTSSARLILTYSNGSWIEVARNGAALLTATATLNFGSLAPQACEELTIPVTGAGTNDAVTLGAPAAIESGFTWNGWVSSLNTVSVRLCKMTTGTVDPASATWRATVIKR